MPHHHCTRQLCLPTGLVGSIKRRIATPLAFFLKPNVKHTNKNQNCATELRQCMRISRVVLKPVCTPVPPVKNGSAAGVAGFAPPASALPEKASHRPAASGTLSPGCPNGGVPANAQPVSDTAPSELARNQYTQIFMIFGKPVRLSRPRAADGLDFRALERQPGFDSRLIPVKRPAQRCALRGRSPVSRPGIG